MKEKGGLCKSPGSIIKLEQVRRRERRLTVSFQPRQTSGRDKMNGGGTDSRKKPNIGPSLFKMSFSSGGNEKIKKEEVSRERPTTPEGLD